MPTRALFDIWRLFDGFFKTVFEIGENEYERDP